MQLTSINHNGPVLVTELGQGGNGIVWTVHPENFQSLMDQINKYGGPSAWKIEVL